MKLKWYRVWIFAPDSNMNEILHHVTCKKRITTGVKPDFSSPNAQTIEDLWKHAIISKSTVTTTRPSAAITVSDFLSTGLKDVASGIEVSMTVFFDFKLAYLELSEPGREYHIDSDSMHKHTPNKNYIGWRGFKRCICKTKIVFCKYCKQKIIFQAFSQAVNLTW